MTTIHFRPAVPQDFTRIQALNETEVVWTSPMDIAKIEALHNLASYHKVAEVDGEVVGFLLAMASTDKYHNENFDWFAERYSSFVYIDRIVVDASTKGMGIGRAFYQDLFEFAVNQGSPVVCCEYNLTPVNEPSKVFHTKLGFQQIGERTYINSDKVVSMQAVNL